MLISYNLLELPEEYHKVAYSYFKKEPWIENEGMNYMSEQYSSRITILGCLMHMIKRDFHPPYAGALCLGDIFCHHRGAMKKIFIIKTIYKYYE